MQIGSHFLPGNMMNLTRRNIFLILLMLFIAFSPLLTGYFGLIDEDDDLDDNGLLDFFGIPVIWTKIFVHQVSGSLRLGLSIFALYLVYLGGRSKNKWFNDRTIDPNNSLIVVIYTEAALLRAAFNFSVVGPSLGSTISRSIEVLVQPIFYLLRR